MIKSLNFIKSEDETEYDEYGTMKTSVEKKYFSYSCHEADAECQLQPVVCRVFDKMQPSNEPVWEVDEKVCTRCFATNNRLLEDLYR